MLLRLSLGIAPQEDEACVGKQGVEERNAQGVLRRLFQKAGFSRGYGFPVPVAELSQELGLDVLANCLVDVGPDQTIRADAFRPRAQLWQIFDQAMGFAAHAENPASLGQGFKQQTAAGARRRDDEQGLRKAGLRAPNPPDRGRIGGSLALPVRRHRRNEVVQGITQHPRVEHLRRGYAVGGADRAFPHLLDLRHHVVAQLREEAPAFGAFPVEQPEACATPCKTPWPG